MSEFPARLTLPKTIVIPKGIIATEGPKMTTWGEGTYQLIIPIGKDEVAYLYLHEDAIKALESLEPEVTIL